MNKKLTMSACAMAASVALAAGMGLAGALAPAAIAAPDHASTAAAADASAAADLPSAQIAAMKRDLGLKSNKQVKKRLKTDAQATALEKKLESKLGKAYAGTWVSANGKKIIAGVTTKKAAAKAKALGAKPRLVAANLRSLDRVKTTLDARSSHANKKVTSWYVDPTTNEVVVAATTAKAAQKFIKKSGIDASQVSVELSAAPAVPVYDVRGGDEYTSPADTPGYVTLCSVGFAVNGGFVTAGHCGPAGKPTSGQGAAQGTVQASIFPGNDMAWVKTNSNWNPLPQVTNYSGGAVLVQGSNEAAVGASVCRSGRTTHWQCGTIQAKNVTIHYAVGDVVGAVRMNACAAGGDSGGSVISGNQAQGVMSGVSGDCGTSGFASFYQPINPILSKYGLTLKTTSTTVSIQGYNNKCIDVPGSDFSNSKQLQIWNCNNTNAQKWDFRSDGTVRIGGKCMDLRSSNTSNGNVVQIYTCNGTAAQQFVLSGAGDLVSVLANKCVDVKDWNGDNGGKLQIWECAGTANQKWWKI